MNKIGSLWLNTLYFLFITALCFQAFWKPRAEYAHLPIVGHHAFKTAVHVDTIKHIKNGHVFARSDIQILYNPAPAPAYYFPNDGFLFYLPAFLPQVTEKSFYFFRVQSLLMASLAIAVVALAVLLLTGSFFVSIASLLPWLISPLFIFFNQTLMAEPYLLLGIALLILGTASMVKQNSNLIFCLGLIVTCLAKLDGLIVATLWIGLLYFSHYKQHLKLKASIWSILFSLACWTVLYFISHTPVEAEAVLGISKAYKDSAEAGNFSAVAQPFIYFITEGTWFGYLTGSILILGLIAPGPIRKITWILGGIYLFKSIVLFGYSNVHNYYQFPFIPLISICFANFIAFIRTKINSKWSFRYRELVFIALTVFIGERIYSKFTNEYVRPLYQGWAPGVETFYDSDMNYKNYKIFTD